MPEIERDKDGTEREETKTEGYESRKVQERRNVNMHSSQTEVQRNRQKRRILTRLLGVSQSISIFLIARTMACAESTKFVIRYVRSSSQENLV